ncbi:type II toxin-antitoxin system RelE/ParE family toxin [Thiobacillus sp. 65-1402]|uniref:type II toxin-antitoxin system RelE/ParE family toxin n=1 Tax=Thiobacillus sp. 65-1402 TaxID=1895861 RepID=UPI0025F18FD7|nr:type II toxin-antitoxin system RelE/ParE family toxin [Thiobacillus sp. 65-1402]
MLDMAALRDYIASDAPARATFFIQRLFDHIDALHTFPELGRVVPEVDVANIRELVFQGYRIIYRLSPQRIDILTVLHGSRDLGNPNNRPWEA